jgi:uncharacterized membrane protein
MNDAGVIVGTMNGQAVRWQNNALIILPGLSGLSGYVPAAISPNGTVIGGAAGDQVLLWPTPYSTPIKVQWYFDNFAHAVAVNDDQTMVYNIGDPTNQYYRAYVWRPGQLPQILEGGKEATGMNAQGYISGESWATAYPTYSAHQPVRWDPTGHVTALPFIESGGVTAGINAAGSVVGNAQVPCQYYAEMCVSTIMIWQLDGTIQELFNAPAAPARAISRMNRIIGNDPKPWTYFNGVTTYLSSPDATPPVLVAVDACGSILAQRSDGTGYLWKKDGLLYPCDDLRSLQIL